MKRVFLIIAFILALTVPALSQVTVKEVIPVTVAPVGSACVEGKIYYIKTTGVNYERINGVCTPVTSGGTPGTVTTSGSPASPQLAKFSSGTAITTATATDVSTPLLCTDAGASDTYTCTMAPALASYVAGVSVTFKPNTSNTGAATININALGAKNIKKLIGASVSDPADNDLRAGGEYHLTYDGTQFLILSTLGNPAGITNSAGATQIGISDGTNFVGDSGFTFAKHSAFQTGTVTVTGTTLSAVTSGNGQDANQILNVVGANGQSITAASADDDTIAGNGAGISFSSGMGGTNNSTGANPQGGAGGTLSFNAGAGGGGLATAGAGGIINLTAGAGSANSAVGNLLAGNGGALTLTAGDGGADNKATGTAGTGGNVVITAGNKGAATGGAASGSDGTITFVTNGAVATVPGGATGTIQLDTSTVPTSSSLASDGTTTSATFATTGLSVTVVSGTVYEFTMILFVSDSLAADGAKIDFNGGSAAATNFRAHITSFDSALNLSSQITALNTSVAMATLTGSSMIEVHGSFKPSSSGTFIPRYAQNAHTTGTLTIFAGSNIILKKVG